MTIRVLIADDQVMVREGFSVLLNAHPDIEIVGEAVDGKDAWSRSPSRGVRVRDQPSKPGR